jgi:hypothetical protein
MASGSVKKTVTVTVTLDLEELIITANALASYVDAPAWTRDSEVMDMRDFWSDLVEDAK